MTSPGSEAAPVTPPEPAPAVETPTESTPVVPPVVAPAPAADAAAGPAQAVKPTDIDPSAIRIGHPDPAGGEEKVVEVFTQSERFCIYAVALPGKPDAEIHPAIYTNLKGAENSKITEQIVKFSTLVSHVRTIFPEKERMSVYRQLSAVASHVYRNFDNPPPASIFRDAETKINQYARNEARWYLTMGALPVVVCLSLGYLIERSGHKIDSLEILEAIKCAALGAIGALAIVLTPIEKAQLTSFSSRSSHFFNGILRAMLGAIYGFAAMLLVKGDVFMSFTSGIPALRMFVVFAAGFSDRLIPVIIDNVSTAAKSADSTGSK